jgi:hypothetical protein
MLYNDMYEMYGYISFQPLKCTQIEMGYKSKTYSRIQRLRTKRKLVKYLINNFYIDYVLK